MNNLTSKRTTKEKQPYYTKRKRTTGKKRKMKFNNNKKISPSSCFHFAISSSSFAAQPHSRADIKFPPQLRRVFSDFDFLRALEMNSRSSVRVAIRGCPSRNFLGFSLPLLFVENECGNSSNWFVAKDSVEWREREEVKNKNSIFRAESGPRVSVDVAAPRLNSFRQHRKKTFILPSQRTFFFPPHNFRFNTTWLRPSLARNARAEEF